MRIVVQRVTSASVDVDGQRIAEIERGLLLLVGVAAGDETVDLARIAQKLIDLRVFEDDEGRMNRSLREIGGEILAVSQFTLLGDVSKGRRPSFTGAADPAVASPLFDDLVAAMRREGVIVKTGRFGAKMQVALINDGPVTFVVEVASSRATG